MSLHGAPPEVHNSSSCELQKTVGNPILEEEAPNEGAPIGGSELIPPRQDATNRHNKKAQAANVIISQCPRNAECLRGVRHSGCCSIPLKLNGTGRHKDKAQAANVIISQCPRNVGCIRGERHSGCCSVQERQPTAANGEIDLSNWLSDQSSSGYRGVTIIPGGRFIAQLNVNGSPRRLGTFSTVEEAASAHAREHMLLHGSIKQTSSSRKQSKQAKELESVQQLDRESSRSEVPRKYRAVEKHTVGQRSLRSRGVAPCVVSVTNHDAGEHYAVPSSDIDLKQWRSGRSSSGYRGVYGSIGGGFIAQIRVDGVQEHLGRFGTAEEAATVYAKEYLSSHGAPPEQQPRALSRAEAQEQAAVEFLNEQATAGDDCSLDQFEDNAQNESSAQAAGSGGRSDFVTPDLDSACAATITVDTINGESLSAEGAVGATGALGPTVAKPTPIAGSDNSGETTMAAAAAPEQLHATEDNPQIDPTKCLSAPSTSPTAVREADIEFLGDFPEHESQCEVLLSQWRSSRWNGGYRGVSKTACGAFGVLFQMGGVSEWIGTYDTPEEAATKYAKRYIAMYGAAPAAEGAAPVTNIAVDSAEIQLSQWHSQRSNSGFRGVYRTRSGHFQAKIQFGGTRSTQSHRVERLGIYDTVEEAATAFAQRYLAVHGAPPDLQISKSQTRQSGQKKDMNNVREPPSLRPTKRKRTEPEIGNMHQQHQIPDCQVQVGAAVRVPFPCKVCRVTQEGYEIEVATNDIQLFTVHQLEQLCKQGKHLLGLSTIRCGSVVKLWWHGQVVSVGSGCCQVQFENGSFAEEPAEVMARYLVGQFEQQPAQATCQRSKADEICSICLNNASGTSQVGGTAHAVVALLTLF